jgi:hypothetical protein
MRRIVCCHVNLDLLWVSTAVTGLPWQLLVKASNVEFQKYLSNNPDSDSSSDTDGQTCVTSTQVTGVPALIYKNSVRVSQKIPHLRNKDQPTGDRTERYISFEAGDTHVCLLNHCAVKVNRIQSQTDS